MTTTRTALGPAPLRELLGWVAAAIFAVATMALLVVGPRGDVLFRDGDAVLPLLFSHSLATGQPQDWAMSSVLFIPELALFLLLGFLPLSGTTLLLISGSVWFLLLYGAIRFTAGSRRRGAPAPVFGALIAFGIFCALAASALSSSRDALDLASLMGATTYYGATVVATVLTVGTVRRLLDGGPRIPLLVLLGIVTTCSVMTNPLFLVWAILPLGAILLLTRRSSAAWPSGVLVGGAVAGMVLRIPLSSVIANNGFGYVQPTQWQASVGYYAELLGERLTEPLGVPAALLFVGVFATSIVLLRRNRRQGGERFVLWAAVLAPIAVLLGMMALGTQAARYLQPVVFFAVLGLTALRPRPLPLRRARSLVATGGVLLLAAGVAAVPVAATAATRPDADLACVVDYADAHPDKTGAGQFWSVRLPKSQVADPRTLVQVDHKLNAYAWIVNRDDFQRAEADYLLLDPSLDPAFEAAPQRIVGVRMIECGRYTIAELPQPLPLGPQHS